MSEAKLHFSAEKMYNFKESTLPPSVYYTRRCLNQQFASVSRWLQIFFFIILKMLKYLQKKQ